MTRGRVRIRRVGKHGMFQHPIVVSGFVFCNVLILSFVMFSIV